MEFHKDIIQMARENTYFRQVVATGKHSQVVLMSIPPQGEIGEEVHETVDQILVFVEGKGEAIINDVSTPIEPSHLVFVAAGTKHNFRNIGSEDLKLYTIYSPPQHKDGTIHKTKADAEADTEDHY